MLSLLKIHKCFYLLLAWNISQKPHWGRHIPALCPLHPLRCQSPRFALCFCPTAPHKCPSFLPPDIDTHYRSWYIWLAPHLTPTFHSSDKPSLKSRLTKLGFLWRELTYQTSFLQAEVAICNTHLSEWWEAFIWFIRPVPLARNNWA